MTAPLLNERIAQADAELRRLSEQHPVCQLLLTIPDVGAVTSVLDCTATHTRWRGVDQRSRLAGQRRARKRARLHVRRLVRLG